MSVRLLDSDWAIRTFKASASELQVRNSYGVVVDRGRFKSLVQQYCKGEKTSVGLPVEVWIRSDIDRFGWAKISIMRDAENTAVSDLNSLHGVSLRPYTNGRKVNIRKKEQSPRFFCLDTEELLAFLKTNVFTQLGTFIALFPEGDAAARIEPATASGFGLRKKVNFVWEGSVQVLEKQKRGILISPNWPED